MFGVGGRLRRCAATSERCLAPQNRAPRVMPAQQLASSWLFLYLVVILLALQAAAVANATSLRTGDSEKVASGTTKATSKALNAQSVLLGKSKAELIKTALSTSKSAAFVKLTSKYNCAEDAKSLVSQLNTITIESQAASDTLNQTCATAQSSFEQELAIKIAAADNLTATAARRGEGVYMSGRAIANDTYNEVKAFHDSAVHAASKHLTDTGIKAAEAEAAHSEKSQLQKTAQALFNQKCKMLDDAATTQINVLRSNRDTVVRFANISRREQTASAKRDMNESHLICTNSYSARVTLVAQDEMTINDKIRPLLIKLDGCDRSPANNSSANGFAGNATANIVDAASFIDVGAAVSQSAQCKQAARTKLQRLRTSFLQISLDTPAQEVQGNMGDWAARLDTERTDAANVRDACTAEAQSALVNATRALDTVFADAVSRANGFIDTEVAKVNERTAANKVTQKVALDAAAMPAIEAEVAFNVAKAAMEEAKAAVKAASDMKAFTIAEAQSSLDEALVAAEQARQETIDSTKAAADVLRQNARMDKTLRSKAKKLECDQEHQALFEERDLVDEIRRHIATLTTV